MIGPGQERKLSLREHNKMTSLAVTVVIRPRYAGDQSVPRVQPHGPAPRGAPRQHFIGACSPKRIAKKLEPGHRGTPKVHRTVLPQGLWLSLP